MRMVTRPLKAPTKPINLETDLEGRFPLLASDKEDGIRCLIHPEHGAMSQKLLSIPNKHIRNYLQACKWACLDGELVTYTDGVEDPFHTVQSKVMSEAGYPDFEFRVFDSFEHIYDPYEVRMERAEGTVLAENDPCVTWITQFKVDNLTTLDHVHSEAVLRGKEGIMLRHPRGWYKEGRSTLNEAYLLKVKTFIDDEATVFGIEEEMENCNLATKDNNGLTKRSKHVSGMKGKGRVGVLNCLWKGKHIKVAGLNEELKLYYWSFPDRIIGQTITFKYQPHGMKDLPRCPTFRGIRKD